MSQPVTWDQIIDAAAENDGKVAVQANKYEGYSVWINALISGAGGEIATDTEKGVDLTLEVDSPAGETAASIIEKLAGSAAAPADLSVSNEGTAGGTFGGDAGRVHGQLDLHLDELRRDPARGEGRPRLHPVPAVHAGRGVPPAVRRHRRRRQRVLRARGRGDAGDRVHHLARQPGRERRAHRQHAGQRGRLRVPGAGRDLPAAELLDLFQESLDAAAPRTVTPYWSDISGALQSTWHPTRRRRRARPRRTRSSSSRTCCTEGACCEHRDRHRGGEGHDSRRRQEAQRPVAGREPARPAPGGTGRDRDAGRHGVADDPGALPVAVPLPAHRRRTTRSSSASATTGRCSPTRCSGRTPGTPC